MLRQGTPPREFADADAMRAHYRALQARMWAPRAVAPRPETLRTRALAEAQREREQREAEERRQAELAAIAEMDALVFQILDPEQISREPKRIITRVAEAFGVTYAEIVSDGRTAYVVRARHAAIAAVREARPELSTTQLGKAFNRDHTSILHALRKMERVGVPQPPSTEGGMTHLQILSSATRTGTWKIADDESVLQLIVEGGVVAEVAPWTDSGGEVSFWAASAGTRDLGCGSLLDACRSAALNASVTAPVPDDLRIALGVRVVGTAQPVEAGAHVPLLERFADLLAAILDEPLQTLAGPGPDGGRQPLQLRLAHFRPDLSERAAVLLDEAGR